MKFVVTTENLANSLKRVMPAINSKPSNPVLANILFVADAESVMIAGSDFDVRIETKVPAIVMRPGSITLPAKKLQQIVSVLPSGDVEVSMDDEESQTVSLWALIERPHFLGIFILKLCGKSGKIRCYNFPGEVAPWRSRKPT